MKRDSHSSSAEKKVMAYLGAKSEASRPRPGTKGAADMRVSFSTGTVWNVQVKACRSVAAEKVCQKNAGIELPPSETLVIAKVTPRGIEYRSAKTGRKLTPPGSKR
jgi:hypothetical protein